MDDPLLNTPILTPGTCIGGKYVLGEVLGMGGSAVVYDAEQVGLKRRVAFKVYPIREGTDPTFVERFQREARLLSRVHHENVIAAFDAGTLSDGSPFLVVQRMRGGSLATRLQSGPLPIDEVVELAVQVLHALCALSQAGIVHRDVKPDNLMFHRGADEIPVIKLVDFGVATHVDALADDPMGPGELVGTPHYMSPEQMRGEPVDPRTDLYALGATLYQMLTGHTPHRGETLEEVANATLFAPIAPIRSLRVDCPPLLERMVLKALARERECRYEDATEMRKELERWDATRRSLPLPQAPLHHWQFESASLDSTRAAAARAVLSTQRARDARSVRTVGRGLFLAAVACLAGLGGWTWSRQIHAALRPIAHAVEEARPAVAESAL